VTSASSSTEPAIVAIGELLADEKLGVSSNHLFISYKQNWLINHNTNIFTNIFKFTLNVCSVTSSSACASIALVFFTITLFFSLDNSFAAFFLDSSLESKLQESSSV